MRATFVVILCLIITPVCLSQDYIYKMDGTIQEGKVIEVTIDVVKYYQLELPKGPVFEMLKADVHKIQFKNGYERVVNEKKTNNQTDNALGLDSGESSLSLGDQYQGGVIFFLDTSRQHGLILASDFFLTKVKWSKVLSKTGAVYKHDGSRNTKLILKNMHNNGFNPKETAAYVCDNYSKSGYTDWYLPAINEWILLIENRGIIGESFDLGQYWSSTEMKWAKAIVILMDYDKPHAESRDKYYEKYYVRCIRKF